MAYGVPGLGRFRVNVFQQRGAVGSVRVMPIKIQTFRNSTCQALEAIATR